MLIQASDGLSYVLKMASRKLKNELPLREALGSELATRIGLTVASWQPIYVSDDFIDDCLGSWPQAPDGSKLRPESGYYFGSQQLGSKAGERVYDFLPSALLSRIENRPEFVGMLLLDIWANHANYRQAVFLHPSDSSSLKAVFIDHGAMFSNERDVLLTPMAGRYSDSRMYKGYWTEPIFSFWQERISSIRESSLRESLSRIPHVWTRDCHVARIVSELLVRQDRLRKLKFDSVAPCDLPWKHPYANLHVDTEATSTNYFRIPVLSVP
jgi:hypothetical protein